MDIDIDENTVVTAMLLCGCKKVNNAQDIEKIKSYAKDGAEFLSKLGFSKNSVLFANNKIDIVTAYQEEKKVTY